MSDYIISCCSPCDLTQEHLDSRDVRCIYFHILLDGVDYPDDLGKSINFHDFYEKMLAGADTRTSQVNVDEYVDYFSALAAEGKDILHISLSGGLSGSVNSARNAAEAVMQRFPGVHIYVIDSLGASSGYGLIVDKAADLRDGGMSVTELRDWLEENKLRMHHWFFSTDLKFYIKGGRVSKTSGTIGTILGICPLLNMDAAGHLIPRAKIRSKKKAIQETYKRMLEHAQNGTEYADKCYISHSDCPEDAEALKALVESGFGKINGEVLVNYIGTTIGSHSGPGTIALFFWGDLRD